MENYFPHNTDEENGSIGSHIIKNCSQNTSHNNWHRHHKNHIEKIRNSVEVMEHLSDTDYDKLLSENIVFLNLIDASAVNTVIECIVRNTPLIVNRTPAVVEILGADYPLYYGDIDGNTDDDYYMNFQIVSLLSDTKNLKNAHKYLSNMNKDKFSMENLMSDIIDLIKTI
jgi:hypothetical protein